jgi:hypothetical protein
MGLRFCGTGRFWCWRRDWIWLIFRCWRRDWVWMILRSYRTFRSRFDFAPRWIRDGGYDLLRGKERKWLGIESLGCQVTTIFFLTLLIVIQNRIQNMVFHQHPIHVEKRKEEGTHFPSQCRDILSLARFHHHPLAIRHRGL